MKYLKVAVQGCGHGELDKIYQSIVPNVDLLIITGDFQAIRSAHDLNNISVPQKYRQLGDFHQYYSGKKKAPVLTIFIGGNHESSSYLQELRFGGWVAPNIYYLGEFGVVWYKGLRIGGLSGIYNEISYKNDNEERLPYNPGELRSVYHVRARSIAKMLAMSSEDKMDIFLTHDWPQGIEHYGDLKLLLKLKPFFKTDIEKNQLGSPPAKEIVNSLKPRYCFASHLHVKFEAVIQETSSDEIDLDMDSEPTNESKESGDVQFLALDKCGRNRKHLKILDISTNTDHISFKKPGLYYDNRAIAANKVVETYRLEHKVLPQDIHKFKKQVDEEVLKLTQFHPVPNNFEFQLIDSLNYFSNNQTLKYTEDFGIPYSAPEISR
ncbi:lariat debranching enzyme [[Candida] jaroonii]|uniref:Lariat debranching enzyme n=1 Tax=[Candida] jaroonii TaxID=467808 RepID=A0ACA9Y6H0_9ASCO|nr:lariat debranching enzyme [[Candida] jaroonii]